MASGRQSDIGPNTSRSLEARRIIDRRLEAECGDRADTRHGHEPADLHITTRQLVNLAVAGKQARVVKSRNALMDAAYDDEEYVDDWTIDTHIKELPIRFRAKDVEF